MRANVSDKCLKGNSRAFGAIVAEYQELVCAITYSGTADIQRSEELAHQTFVNAWNKLAQLKDLSRFRPWLCSIARNNVRFAVWLPDPFTVAILIENSFTIFLVLDPSPDSGLAFAINSPVSSFLSGNPDFLLTLLVF